MARKKNSSSAPDHQADDASTKRGVIIVPASGKDKPSDAEAEKVSPSQDSWRKPSMSEAAKGRDYLPFRRFPPFPIGELTAGKFLETDEGDLLATGPISVDAAEQKVRQQLADAVAPLARELMSRRMATDEFTAELGQFAQAYFERHDEANPPPVPEQRFTPRKDQILDFLKSVWGEWIGKRLLTKPLLKAHDDKAYDALMNWQRANTLPDDVYVPTQKEANDRFLKRRYFTVDECHRVVGLLTRRDKDGKQ